MSPLPKTLSPPGSSLEEIKITLHHADCTGVAGNCFYPHRVTVSNEHDLMKAVSYDYVCAEYTNAYRSNSNFICSNCLAMDVDNDHSDDPKDWVGPMDVSQAFPEVWFAVHYSRNHMKKKDDKAARPKFHVLFAVDQVTDAAQYRALKKRVCELFPYFDGNATDAGRFFYGTPSPKAEIFRGGKTLTDYLADKGLDVTVPAISDARSPVPTPFYVVNDVDGDEVIPQGYRNSTMSHYAGRVIVRLGDTDDAYHQFLREAQKCDPPLSDAELQAIWGSAQQFYQRVSAQPGYVPPAQFRQQDFTPVSTPTNSGTPPNTPSNPSPPTPKLTLCPADLTDVGQAKVLAREYENKLRYSEEMGWHVFNGSFWEVSDSKAQRIAQELTARQLAEAESEIARCEQELQKNGAWAMLESVGAKKAVQSFSNDQRKTYKAYEHAKDYHKHVLKCRGTQYIAAMLKEARTMLLIAMDAFDRNPYLLNTPSYTINLKTGTPQDHNYLDYITMQTAVDPSDDGIDYWEDALDTFFCADQALIEYVQMTMGMAIIGKVMDESLIIAYGEGGNGKSTLFNTLAREISTYAGNIPSEVLIASRSNRQHELAELYGKRLVIAAELEAGLRLSSKRIKQIASTDKITARRLYHDAFHFTPVHKLVLFSNYLPRVSELDNGTWRRLVVLPFQAQIPKSADMKNYSDFLHEHAGGAILKWMIEGAVKIIANNYRLDTPPAVQAAIQQYKSDNNWLDRFLEECCEIDPSFKESSMAVYTAYKDFSSKIGEYTYKIGDFYKAIEAAGYLRHRTGKVRQLQGLRLRSEFSVAVSADTD